MTAHPFVEIGLVPYPGAQQAAIYGLTDLFDVANRFATLHQAGSTPLLHVSHRLPAEPGVADETPDVLIFVPRIGTPLTREGAAPFLDWVIEHHGKGATLATVCGGAFLLAETGLLDGRATTTHWDHAELFRQRFPRVKLDIDKLIIDDGDIISAGGIMAWIDLGLKIVDRFLGPTIMAETAHYLLVDPPGREQCYYSAFSPNLTHGDAAILKVQHWLQAKGAKETTLASLASCAGLEERTFLRRFRKATGLTAVDYCQRLKVGKACELLQFTTQPAEAIAWQVGYTDAGAFRKIFLRITGLTPGEYRRRFSVNRT
jgi:transcriptional regulator GlxA family with amidase domain